MYFSQKIVLDDAENMWTKGLRKKTNVMQIGVNSQKLTV